MNHEDNFEIKYEYVQSKQSEIRLQQTYEMVFEEIEKLMELDEEKYDKQQAKN